MKCLFYGENPLIDTGAAQISKRLIRLMLDMGWQVEVVGINGWELEDKGEFSQVKFYEMPFDASSQKKDFYNIKNAKEVIPLGNYDLLFLTGDFNHVDEVMPFALAAREKFGFPIISYVVIDCDFDFPYLSTFNAVDYPFVYSQYAVDVLTRQHPGLKDKLRLIELGVDTDVIKPISPERRQFVRENYYEVPDPDTFVIINVNRNQRRKDITRSAYAYHLFHQKYPNSVMYIHAQQQDLGGNLPTQLHLLRMDKSLVIMPPAEYNVIKGYQRELLNEVYGIADVYISTSQGEGWGLTTTEAMAAGVPIIVPNNTTFPYHVGKHQERGYLVKSGGPDLWIIHYELGDEPRELTSVTDMVKKLEHVYLHRDEAKRKADRALKWAKLHDWSFFMEKWQKVFTEIENTHGLK